MTTSLAARTTHAVAKPSGFRCQRGELDLIPTNKLLAVAQKFLELNGIKRPTEFLDMGLMFETMGILFRWVDEHLMFRDWKYELSSISLWDDDSMIVEFSAKRKYSLSSLTLNRGIIVEYELWGYAHHHGMGDDSHHSNLDPMAEDFLVWLKDFFEETNEHIMDWNDICRRSVPLLSERMPVEELRDNFLRTVYDVVIESAYSMGFDGDPDEAFDHYAEEYDCIQGFELAMIWEEGFLAKSFGPKHDWNIRVDIETFDMVSLYSFYMTRKGCPVVWKLLEFDTYHPDVELEVNEAEFYFYETVERIEDAMVEWNRSIMYGSQEENGSPFRAMNQEGFSAEENAVYEIVTQGVVAKDPTPLGYTQLRFDV